ncbi:hypothetical protein AP064_03935 [Candidatus Liberibacter solanacearum]|uniref:Lipoprotein n=1 Tax=Candidatus Liberibacter solanacearum TaxID=556287 RepID=A0A0F4VJX3_9HYPH|nr:hypothetical protein [Candidatus Liberibacter solanacearum]KJZ81204.1 hypothetical protein KP07_01555 [Candidatus Liberibacter solanacearum]KJZ81669.1 hypothetical protein DJ66_0391 [Candidatus Liberibacter solanacearum]KQC48938.1 hypothetical protein AP064_03935 [Candidatus Liberibacter solanacearum]
MKTKKFIPFFILLSTVVIGGCNSDDIKKIRQIYPNLSNKELQSKYKEIQGTYPNLSNKELWDRRESLKKAQNQENIAESEKTSHISDKIEADIRFYRQRFLRTDNDNDNIPPKTPRVEKKVHFDLKKNKYYDPDQSQNMNPES